MMKDTLARACNASANQKRHSDELKKSQTLITKYCDGDPYASIPSSIFSDKLLTEEYINKIKEGAKMEYAQMCAIHRKFYADEIKIFNGMVANCEAWEKEYENDCTNPKTQPTTKPKPTTTNPNSTPPPGFTMPTVDLNRRCPKVEKYFPKDRIESIYGKKVVFMNPSNQETIHKYDDLIQESETMLEEVQRQAQQLGIPTEPITKSKTTYSFKGFPDSKDWEGCGVFFIDPTGGYRPEESSASQAVSNMLKGIEEMIMTNFILFNSPEAAQKNFNALPELPQNLEGTTVRIIKDVKVSGLGDEGRYIKSTSESTGPPAVSIPSYYLSARKGSFVFFVSFYKESDYSKAEELLKKAVGSADFSGDDAKDNGEIPKKEEPIEPKKDGPTKPKKEEPKKETCSASSELVVTSYTPKETYAGDAGTGGRPFSDSEGYVLYYPRPERMELAAECLEGLIASSSDLGIDGKPAIIINWVQSSADGTKAYVSIYVSQYAKDGDAKILLKNKHGKGGEIKLKVSISGTQYLNRLFESKKIKFFGSWPVVDERVKKLESETRQMLELLVKPNYANLDIFTKIYETEIWKEKSAQLSGVITDSGKLLGFTRTGTNVIYIGEQYSIDPNYGMPATVLHEAVHQLHFCYRGNHPSAKKKCQLTTFDSEWWSKMRLSSLLSCKYLPPLGPNSWVGGDKLPRCGFIRAYGASDLPRTVLSVSLPAAYALSLPQYEDVATMKQHSVYRNGDFSKGDAASSIYKQVYLDKLKLLDKYGF